jgi:hypothetical protein
MRQDQEKSERRAAKARKAAERRAAAERGEVGLVNEAGFGVEDGEKALVGGDGKTVQPATVRAEKE